MRWSWKSCGSWARAAWLLGCVVGGLGCSRASDAPLLEVSGVEPRVLERGDVLEIAGSGFPAGHAAVVSLRGVLHRAGARPLSVRAELSGAATRVDRVEVELDDASLAQLGGAGSFDGTLQVAFETARGGDQVTGNTRVSLDLLGARQALRLAAQEVLARTGIVLADTDTLHGLRIAEVKARGLAERAGLRAGDVVTRVAEVRVHALADFAPSESATSLALRIKRAGEPAAVAISLQLTSASARAAQGFDAQTLQRGVLWCFVLLVLLFASPLPSPTPLVTRVLLAAPPAPGPQLPAVAALALLPLSLVALAVASAWPLDALWVLGAALLCSLPLVIFARERSRRALATALGHALALSVVVSCVCASSGTRALGGIIAQQGVAPFSWKLFTHPELLVGFALYAVHASHLVPAVAMSSRPVTRAWTACVTGLVSLLGACLFLGGHSVATSSFEPLFLGSAWLLVKALCVAGLIALLRRVEPHPLHAGRRAAVFIACVAAGTWASIVVAPGPELERALGAVLGTTALCALLIATLQARRSLAALSGGFPRALPETD